VTKKRRQSNTCSLLVCLHGSSGSVFSSHWTYPVWRLDGRLAH
jgi:hypothetical protein